MTRAGQSHSKAKQRASGRGLVVRDVNVRVRVREGSSVEIQWKHKSGRGLVTIENETEKVEEGDEDESN